MTPVNASPHLTGQRPAPAGLFRAPKIQPWHLDRLAIVYVRQSTAQQVAENKESTDRQYALVNRAIELGWGYGQELCLEIFQAAGFSLIPSLKTVPLMTSTSSGEPFNDRQPLDADSISLNTIVRHATRLPLPLVLS
jgi:hypothetical protein